MALTLQNLIDELKAGLRVFDQWSVAHAVGDGVTTRYKLPDYPVIDPLTMLVAFRNEEGTIAPIGAVSYDLDEASGSFAFNSPPEVDIAIQWTWKWAAHSSEELISLINAGVRYIASDIKVEGLFDDTTETELFTWEYAAPEGATRIKKVELCYDNELSPWTPYHYWETINKEGQLYVKFNRHPGIMWCRMWYDVRPTPFLGTLTNGVYTEDLATTTLLPETAFDPILHYAVWIALHRAVTYRSRDDAAQHLKDEAAVTMRDLESRVSASKTLFELHLSRFSSEMDHGRLIQ